MAHRQELESEPERTAWARRVPRAARRARRSSPSATAAVALDTALVEPRPSPPRPRAASKRTFAALRPGRATAGWSFRISSFVVTSTSTRRPWPISPSTTFRKRESPWPMTAFASGWRSSPVSSSTSRRQRLAARSGLSVLVAELDLPHVALRARPCWTPSAPPDEPEPRECDPPTLTGGARASGSRRAARRTSPGRRCSGCRTSRATPRPAHVARTSSRSRRCRARARAGRRARAGSPLIRRARPACVAAA